MSQLPMYKKCRKCNRYYAWNPSVGQISCPHCMSSKIAEGLLKILKK